MPEEHVASKVNELKAIREALGEDKEEEFKRREKDLEDQRIADE
jgi:hypothetical protein